MERVIGVDSGKTLCSLVLLDARRGAVDRRLVGRDKLLARLSAYDPCILALQSELRRASPCAEARVPRARHQDDVTGVRAYTLAPDIVGHSALMVAD